MKELVMRPGDDPRAKDRSVHLVSQRTQGDTAQVCHSGPKVPDVSMELATAAQGLSIPEDMMSKNNLGLFRVTGDGLSEDDVCDGDYLIVERRTVPNDGDLVVACFHEATVVLRRFFRCSSGIRLESANPSHPPMQVDQKDVAVQGIVLGILRKYGTRE